MGIGKRVKEARERLGLTQKELGEIIGVTASAVTNYENGTSHPKEPVMYALIDALKVDANFLFQDEVKKEIPIINDRDLKIAFWNNPDEDDELLNDVRKYAQFVKERKKAQDKQDEKSD